MSEPSPAQGILVTLFAVALSVSALPSASAQSDETCIAYMEADAAYETMPHATSAQAQALLKALARWGGASKRMQTAFSAFSEAVTKGSYAAERSAEGPAKLAATQAALRATETALQVWLTALEESSAARVEYEKTRAAALAQGRTARDAAYREAYKGPTSPVESVMENLIEADRERCRRRLE